MEGLATFGLLEFGREDRPVRGMPGSTSKLSAELAADAGLCDDRWNKNGTERSIVNNAPYERKKARSVERAFFDANAGDYLISHTLSRAVPSARRGLTSVFGMGTGVTLAVCSPASLMRRLVVVFPQPSSLHTRAVFPRNESGKLAPQTCI